MSDKLREEQRAAAGVAAESPQAAGAAEPTAASAAAPPRPPAPWRKSALAQVIGQVIARAKLLFALLLAAIAGAIAFTLLPPLVLERIVDSLASQQPVGLQLALLYFAALAAGCLFDSAREALITVFGQKITRGLRAVMCQKLGKLPAGYSISNAPGVTVSRFVNDVDTVQALFTSGIISMFADACTIVGIVAMIFTKSLGLGVLLVAVTPLLFAFTRFVQRRTLAAQVDNRVAVGRVSNCIPETIRSIRTIRTCGAEGFMQRRYHRSIQGGYDAMERSNFYDSVYSPVIMLVSAVIIGLMMVLAASGGEARQFFGMSVGTSVAIIAYVGRVFDPLQSIGMELQSIQSAIAGVRRVNEFLDEPQREPADESLTADALLANVRAGAPCIQLDGVTFGYDPQRPVLRGRSLSVRQGEHATLVGRTGAGKSTIFKLVLGLYAPVQGQVLVCGTPAHRIPDSQKRRLFGYVEQQFRLVPGTVAQQVTLFDPLITRAQVEAAAQLVGLHQHICQLPQGYDTPCEAGLFSQGQWQLLSIARAVAANPAILLLDEITANLDSATERQVLGALERAASNRTVLSISHRLFAQAGGRRIPIGEE